MKCNKDVEKLFEETLNQLIATPKNVFNNEQGVINKLLKSSTYSHLKVGVFPNEIWAYSNQPMPSPDEIILHHANCTLATHDLTSLQRKLLQLKQIKQSVSSNSRV